MTLIELKKYLMGGQVENLFSLAKHFLMTPEIMQDMLEVWINKGCVSKSVRAPKCGKTCGHCDARIFEYYVWNQGASGAQL